MKRKHDDKYKQLSLNIGYYRRKNEITQEQLAEKLDISRTHMSNIEAPNMEKSLSLELLFDIADALGVEVGKLFEVR